MYFDPQRSKQILSIPSEFSTLSKGKIGHAKILLASAIREFINAGNVYKWDIAFNSENQKIFLPLDPTGNVKTGAVQLLELARASAGNVSETQSKHSDILIVDHKFVQGQPILLIIKINDSITEVSVDYPEYMAELVSKVIPAALCFESNPYHNQSQEIQEILTGITQVSDQKFQIFQRQVNKAWNELFPNPVDLNLSYFANGGDSIQAIR